VEYEQKQVLILNGELIEEATGPAFSAMKLGAILHRLPISLQQWEGASGLNGGWIEDVLLRGLCPSKNSAVEGT
jgi:hypothetical protein